MSWLIKTDSTRIPWEEKKFLKRDEFESYLKYFGIDDYKGPGTYISSKDNSDVVITYLEDKK